MKWFDYTALTLVIIGAINWLLVGIFRFDLVAFLFGNFGSSGILAVANGLCTDGIAIDLISYGIVLIDRDSILGDIPRLIGNSHDMLGVIGNDGIFVISVHFVGHIYTVNLEIIQIILDGFFIGGRDGRTDLWASCDRGRFEEIPFGFYALRYPRRRREIEKACIPS